MIERNEASERLRRALARAPVVVLTGPRQAGKTTLARTVGRSKPDQYFDCEDPRDAALLADPMLALSQIDGLVTIDEAQRIPALFPVLRVLVDRPSSRARFLILGSASPDLVGLAAETLAGRVEILELAGLSLSDVGASVSDTLWRRGGLPPSFTAASEIDSIAWRDNYIATFLERDLGMLGSRVPAATMRRAWTMIAHYHGQLWNGAELARSLGVNGVTARRYLDALTDALVVSQLPPWFANVAKRQLKSPKVYVRDTGLLHRLLGISDAASLDRHPKVGASWEGWVIEQLRTILAGVPLYFWRTQDGAELDVYTELESLRIGFEIKRTSVPTRSRSMHSALSDLHLDQLVVIYPGDRRFTMGDRILAEPAGGLLLSRDVDTLLGHLHIA